MTSSVGHPNLPEEPVRVEVPDGLLNPPQNIVDLAFEDDREHLEPYLQKMEHPTYRSLQPIPVSLTRSAWKEIVEVLEGASFELLPLIIRSQVEHETGEEL